MAYAILRTQKLKTIQKIASAGMHNNRKMEVENANPELTKQNKLLAGSDDPHERYKYLIEKAGIKERSNGVKAIELVLTFSPEMKGNIDIDQWCKDNLEWVSSKFGKGAILSMHLHMDETTPHIQAIVAPIKKKQGVWKLCCRDFLGGADKMIALQTSYAEAMKPHGLERGMENSRAKHQTIKRYYGELNKDVKLIEKQLSELDKPGLFNFKKVVSEIRQMLKSALTVAARADKLEHENDSLRKKISDYQYKLFDVNRNARGLSNEEIAAALSTAAAEKLEKERVISERSGSEFRAVPAAPSGPERDTKPASKTPSNRSRKRLSEINDSLGIS